MTEGGNPSRDRVLEALSTIRDPETQLPIIGLGQLDSVEVRGDGTVEVIFHPVSPYTPIVLVCKLALDIANALRTLERVRVLRVLVSEYPLSAYLNRSLDKVLGDHNT